MEKIKKVLVTGATGNLGYAVTQYLKDKGYSVIATGRTIKEHQYFDNFIAIDLSTANLDLLVKSFGKVDYVVHCAALVAENANQDDYWVNNVFPMVALKEYAYAIGANKFIFISSADLYYKADNAYNITEQTVVKLENLSMYAQSKADAEKQCLKAFANSNRMMKYLKKGPAPLTTIILRPCTMFGVNDNKFLLKFTTALAKPILLLPRKGHVLQDFVSVENVAHSVLCALEQKIANNSIFNITTQEPWYLEDVLKKIKTIKSLTTKIWNIGPLIEKLIKYINDKNYERKTNKQLIFTTSEMQKISYDLVLDNEASINRLKYTPLLGMKDSLEYALGVEQNRVQ